jgi:hypothetical protein
MFLNRDNLATTPSLKGAGPIVFIEQEILQRPQQERPEPAFSLIRAGQRVLLEQMFKKTLDQILRVSGRKTAVAKKTIKRRPISFAKPGEGPL